MRTVMLAVALLCCSTVFAAEEVQVEKSFKDFCKEWMSIIKKNKPNNVFCREDKGAYVAEYSSLGDAHDAKIKKTVNKKTPYIGILKYREKVFKNKAATRERAIAGPFTAASERNVTELFVFQEGKWQW
jgi:hypothetical protein